MIRLAIGTLRRHRGSYLGTFVAAVLAIALLAGGGVLLASVLTAKPPADRFAAAPIVVSAPREVSVTTKTLKKDKVKTKVKTERLTGAGTLPANLPERLRGVPGVSDVIADHAFPVRATTADGSPLRGRDDAPVVGHGWASAPVTPYTLTSGRPPGPGEAVVDGDLARRAGDTLTVTTKTGVRTLRIVGIAEPAGSDALPAQGALFLADADVAAVSGLSGPTAVAVLTATDADVAAVERALRAVVGNADVRTGDDRVRADLPGALPDYIGPISIFGFVIGITAFAAVFVLTGTVTLSVRQRLRELALLRTIGATPRQLRRLLGLESIALAMLAALPGAPLGLVVAELVAERFRDLGTVPAQFEVGAYPAVLIAAAFVGVVVTYVGARIAGRRAVRIAPTQALTETATAPTGGLAVRIPVAVVTTAGAIALLTFVPLGGPFGMGMSFLSTALVLCAIAALGPLLVRPLTGLVSRVLGVGGASGWLAGQLARAEARRVSAVAVPLVLMFAINAVMLLNSTLLTDLAADEQTARTAPATAQVSAPTGLPLATVDRIAALPGVTGAAATLPTRVVVEQGGKPEDYAAQGLRIAGAEPALDLAVEEGALGGSDSLAASSYVADQYGWHVGDRIPVWMADGHRVTLRLTAIYQRARGFGELVVPADLVAAHDPVGLASVVGLRYEGDVADRLRADFPGVRVTPTATAAPAGDAANQQGGWELLVVISLGFTAVAVVNTFAIAISGRRRELADLRLAGATTGQVQRLLDREALITVSVGLVLGAVVTGLVVGRFSLAQDGTFRVFVDAVTYLGMLGGVGALGLIAGALPGRILLGRPGPAVADV
ncbi:FtsX-like permease family protein [Cryptosporangium minutisporangium]|uniref:FtsX-like permease family protein n=1 Tax=Cryptosporangium minutisporangium TaxID=113569 RepID=A0ABP6T889_9ACTN